jgi:hypothetical protein
MKITMTQKRFLTILTQLAPRANWRFTGTGVLRTEEGQCPITFVAELWSPTAQAAEGLIENADDWEEAAHLLGLDVDTSQRLAHAADNELPRDPMTRQQPWAVALSEARAQLLRAVGTQE